MGAFRTELSQHGNSASHFRFDLCLALSERIPTVLAALVKFPAIGPSGVSLGLGCQPPRGAQFPVPEAEIPCSRGKGCLKFPVPNEQGILTKRGATPDSYAVENAARSAEI